MGDLNLIPPDYVMDALFIHDAEQSPVGLFLEANQAACEQLGFTREELLKMTPLDIDDPDSAIDIRPVIEALTLGKPVLFEQVHVTKDGRKIPVEVHARPIQWKGRKAVASIVRDISSRKAAESALRVSEENFRSAFSHALAGQVIVAPDGTFIEVNPAFASMLGYTPKELVGKRVNDVTRPDDSGITDRVFQAMLIDGSSYYRTTKRYVHRDGRIVWGEVSSAAIRNVDGSLKHFITQVVDITDRIQADELKRQYQERLETMVEERTRQLQESNSALQFFAYVASHDLREPLIKISAFGQRLEERYAPELSPTGQQYLKIMQNAATRMLNLIDNILAYSRVGKDDSPLMIVDVGCVIREVISDLEVSIQEAGAVIRVSGSMPRIQARSMQIRQVFQNLISNAIKFRKAGVPPIVQITGQINRGWATITISDNGIGFDQQYADKIFTIFTRLHTRFEYPGTGIGLAMCRRILDQYKGTISAKGEPNVGATFTIRIPLITGQIRTVLVADDHDVVVQGIWKVLEPEKDFHIIGQAPDGATAVAMVRRLVPDIVILDVNMPGMNGVEAARRITTEFPKILVIALSMGPHDIMEPMMLKAGARAYFKKEDSLQGLVNLIRELLASEGSDGR